MNKDNIGALIFIIIICIFVAFIIYSINKEDHTPSNILQFYNNCDENDFDKYNDVFLFNVCQLKQIVNWTKESNISGGWFLFMGGFSGSSSEIENFNYYTYVKDKTGGIYFMKIPAEKTRIYQDSAHDEVVICAQSNYKNNTSRNEIADVDTYQWFNIHIPEGTIIQKIDKVDIDNFAKEKVGK
jgi:hypothetical protein